MAQIKSGLARPRGPLSSALDVDAPTAGWLAVLFDDVCCVVEPKCRIEGIEV